MISWLLSRHGRLIIISVAALTLISAVVRWHQLLNKLAAQRQAIASLTAELEQTRRQQVAANAAQKVATTMQASIEQRYHQLFNHIVETPQDASPISPYRVDPAHFERLPKQ